MIDKDWTGNDNSMRVCIGARGYAKEERETYDYYATEPKAARLLMQVETFSPMIWECACGEGHLAEEFKNFGYSVFASDIVDRGYGAQIDFLTCEHSPFQEADIITNPPYSKAIEFVRHALQLSMPGHKVAMFLKIQFLEGQRRKEFFLEFPPRTIYVSSSRLRCAKNGDFEKYGKESAFCYAWYVWENGWQGDTTIKWIN